MELTSILRRGTSEFQARFITGMPDDLPAGSRVHAYLACVQLSHNPSTQVLDG